MDHLIKSRCHLIRKVGSLMLGSRHYCAIPVSPDSLGTIYSGTYNGKLLTSCCSRPLEISRPGQITSAILPFSVRLLGTLINIGLGRGNYQGEFLLCLEKFCFDLALGMASWYRSITITFPSREELFSPASFISDSPHPHVSVLTSQSCQSHLSLQKEKKYLFDNCIIL